MTQKTSLHSAHQKLGAKFVEFGGWDMPVQYSNIKDEHNAVRTKCGMFDVSHMGECWITGPHATTAVNNLITNDVDKIPNYKALYTVMCYDDGGAVDDLIVYKVSPEKIMICLNASNVEKDLSWMKTNLIPGAELRDVSQETGLISVQGPETETLITKLSPKALEGPSVNEMKAFQFARWNLNGIEVWAARTGYTGEDGFEFFHNIKDSEKLWNIFLEHGALPCGLGARDTLRLEAALPLYGHELGEDRMPSTANLGWVIKLGKSKFIGKSILATQQPKELLIGFEMTEPGIARQGYEIGVETSPGLIATVGIVTSGAPSPTLQKNIGLGFVKKEVLDAGKLDFAIKIRDRWVKCKKIPTPFITKRPKK